MKRIIFLSILVFLSVGFVFAEQNETTSKLSKKDSAKYIEVTAKIVDSQTEKPVVFASIVISGTSIATVSNNDGEFILKVPANNTNGSLLVTHIGYKNTSLTISGFQSGNKEIMLTPVATPIDEVIVRTADPIQLLKKALMKVKVNYLADPEMQVGFYRETIQENNKYVAVSEAIMDIYKTPYRTTFESDRIRIYKGRKSQDVKKMDTVMVKLQGGPRTSLMLDLVKYPGDILNPEMLEYYQFELDGITSIDNKEAFIISFDQINGLEYPLYAGKIYIDVESYAFSGVDFRLSEKGLPYASQVLVQKKPVKLDIDVVSAHYLTKYRFENGQWYLTYVRSQLLLNSKWKKKLFKSKYAITLEMAVTDRDKEHLDKFPLKESAKVNDFFIDQVSSFEDPDFWGDYNTIKPDESIEVAIEKLNKKLKRRQ